MNLPSIDIKNFLVTEGVGSFGENPSGWSIFLGHEPETPDETITIYDTPGERPHPKWLLDYPRFQVRVRSFNYEDAGNKAEEVKSVLLGLLPQDIGGTRYDGIYVVLDTFLLKADERKRYIFVNTWRVIREPTIGANRLPL
jgi:hypothetical protein